MAKQIKIELTTEAQKIVTNLQTLPVRVVNYIAAAMNQSNQLAIAKIQRGHLTGQGPFPPDQHKLGVVAKRLLGSVTASEPVIDGTKVNTSIGSNVKYAAIHEFGGVINLKAQQRILRFKTVRVRGKAAKYYKSGKIKEDEVLESRGLARQGAGNNLLIFAGKDDTNVYEKVGNFGARQINMPERAPFRTGIQESLPIYKKNISAGIVEAWKSLSA